MEFSKKLLDLTEEQKRKELEDFFTDSKVIQDRMKDLNENDKIAIQNTIIKDIEQQARHSAMLDRILYLSDLDYKRDIADKKIEGIDSQRIQV